MWPIFRRIIRNQLIGLVLVVGWGNLLRCAIHEIDHVTWVPDSQCAGGMCRAASGGHRSYDRLGAFDMTRVTECTHFSTHASMWVHALFICGSLTIEALSWVVAWAGKD
jgi:hypothetical protein